MMFGVFPSASKQPHTQHTYTQTQTTVSNDDNDIPNPHRKRLESFLFFLLLQRVLPLETAGSVYEHLTSFPQTPLRLTVYKHLSPSPIPRGAL
jgi:hypothetical protein